MKVRSNGFHQEYLRFYDRKLHAPYDYKHEGLNKRIMSHKIYNTKNPILKTVLDIYEKNIVFILNYVDILQNIFNYNWKNR